MTLKSVLFTFDYELFLGNKSGTVQECLIKPTNHLLLLLKNVGFKAIFFIDTVYLLRLKEVAIAYTKAANDLVLINEQLKQILQQGHYIFPHVHAHWLDANYLEEINEWSLTNTRYYQFSSLPNNRQDYLFNASVEILRSLANILFPNYKIDSYRAGGWSIQPFNCFHPHFLTHGISNDFSVIPGKYHFSNAHSFDFRKAPLNIPVYNFNVDVCAECKDGFFKEWTISTLSMSKLEKWIDFKISGIIKRTSKKEIVKGSTIESNIFEEGDVCAINGRKRIIASFEGLNVFRLKKYIKAIEYTNYFQFISHPKLLNANDFFLMEKLFISLKKKFKIETDFRKND